jgi:Zn-dependent protease
MAADGSAQAQGSFHRVQAHPGWHHLEVEGVILELREFATGRRFSRSFQGRLTSQLFNEAPMSQPPQSSRYLRLSVFGLPVYLHWSLPALGSVIGGLVMFLSGGLSLPIFLWSSLSCIALAVIHELGHAAAARAAALQVHGIILAGNGGWCVTSEPKSIAGGLLLYSGGLLAQLLVLILVVLSLWWFGAPTSLPLNCAVIVLTGGNVVVMLINAIPRGTNDGARIATLVRQALGRSVHGGMPK